MRRNLEAAAGTRRFSEHGSSLSRVRLTASARGRGASLRRRRAYRRRRSSRGAGQLLDATQGIDLGPDLGDPAALDTKDVDPRPGHLFPGRRVALERSLLRPGGEIRITTRSSSVMTASTVCWTSGKPVRSAPRPPAAAGCRRRWPSRGQGWAPGSRRAPSGHGVDRLLVPAARVAAFSSSVVVGHPAGGLAAGVASWADVLGPMVAWRPSPGDRQQPERH